MSIVRYQVCGVQSLFLICICFWLMFFSVVVVSSSTIYAVSNDEVIDDVAVSVPVSCNIQGTGMNSHNAGVPNGTYQADIGTTTLKAFCNDNEGFAIYATGYTGNTIGETNSNKLVGTAASNNATIVTGLATSTPNPDESNWAMKLTASSDSGDTSGTNALTIDSAPNVVNGANASFSQYHTVPNEYTKVAHKNSATNMDSTNGGVTLTSTYAAYISKTQAADTYSGQVIYTLVHPASEEPLQPDSCPAGNICYQADGNNVIGTMANQDVRAIDFSSCYESDNETYCFDSNYDYVDMNTLPRYDYTMADTDLFASNFSRTGYGFAGWSDAYDYATNPNAHFYGPMEQINLPSDIATKGLILHAVWVPSEGSLQDTTKVTSLCGTNGTGGTLTTVPTNGTANLSSVTALTDQRDNQTYAIARLADGNCWMIENLRLGNTATTGATNTALARGYNSSFTGLASPESANFNSSTTANSLYSVDGSTNNTISGSYQAYRFPRYNNSNTQQRAETPATNVANIYSYGNYYTWHAAIADTTYYNTNNQSITNTSICPTGWRLPKGANKSNEANNEIWSLVVDGINGGTKPASYDTSAFPHYAGTPEGSDLSIKLRKYPNNFIYSGILKGSSFNLRGTYGSYWSSTVNSNYYAYYLSLNSSYVYPATDSTYKYEGRNIRCIASADV